MKQEDYDAEFLARIEDGLREVDQLPIIDFKNLYDVPASNPPQEYRWYFIRSRDVLQRSSAKEQIFLYRLLEQGVSHIIERRKRDRGAE